MKLKHLHDNEILDSLRAHVQNERELLTQILHHLREVESRKLFCDLGYKSVFEYCVRELKYSEGQAGRRIQAMRLLKELPQLESKIQDGTLSLTTLSQAQSYFREKAKFQQVKSIAMTEKTMILKQLENTTSRETEKILLTLNPTATLPQERERQITENHVEVRFVMDEKLKNKLEQIRSLLGPKAIKMNFAELIEQMAEISSATLTEKKFGKRKSKIDLKNQSVPPTPAPELHRAKTINRTIKHQIYLRDNHRCSQCKSTQNLNIDHIEPKALGGTDDTDNLRLLCFHCNQRQAIIRFGSEFILSARCKQ